MSFPRLPKVGDKIQFIQRHPCDLWGINPNMEQLILDREYASIHRLVYESKTIRGVSDGAWSWPLECVLIEIDGVWYSGEVLWEWIQSRVEVSVTPPPQRKYKIESKIVKTGVQRSGHNYTQIQITNTENNSAIATFVVESDVTNCCGMAGLRGVSRDFPIRDGDQLLVAELCAAIMNAGMFGTPINGRPAGYSPGNFFFSTTDSTVKSPRYARLYQLFVEVFGAECIHVFKNEAHGPSDIHLFKMNLHKMDGIFVTRAGDGWKPLPEKELDGEGLFVSFQEKISGGVK